MPKYRVGDSVLVAPIVIGGFQNASGKVINNYAEVGGNRFVYLVLVDGVSRLCHECDLSQNG